MHRRLAATTLFASLSGLASYGMAQESLSLDEALRLAMERNGTVRSAMLDVAAQRARVRQVWASFWPTVTPTYRLSDTRSDIRTGNTGVSKDTTHSLEVDSSWQILDSGERSLTFASSRRALEAQEFTAQQTLRVTLFTVAQQFLDALRSQELLRVADLQVERAKTILDQTEAQVRLGDAPQKDILQARADYLNATVQQIQSRNSVFTTESSLKATIGWEETQELPDLAKLQEAPTTKLDDTREVVVERGLTLRPDLLAQRKRLESSVFDLRRRQLDAGLTWSLDAGYTARFAPDVRQDRSLSLLFTVPLFDAGRSAAVVSESKYALAANQSDLEQFERELRSEIESAYVTHEQNAARMEAAKLALEAAEQNYRAASESQRLGAEGTTIVTVLTAQVSLVTAESNYIEALYDFYLSGFRLRLVSGDPVPGEM